MSFMSVYVVDKRLAGKTGQNGRKRKCVSGFSRANDASEIVNRRSQASSFAPSSFHLPVLS